MRRAIFSETADLPVFSDETWLLQLNLKRLNSLYLNLKPTPTNKFASKRRTTPVDDLRCQLSKSKPVQVNLI
jgi:hypothetical protein